MTGIRLVVLGGALLIFLVGVITVFFCSGVTKETEKSTYQLASIKSIPEHYWRVLAKKRIFFGHQSVGRNIIEGIIDVMAAHPEIELNIVDSSAPRSIEGAALFHDNVGRNTRPNSKLNGFKRVLNSMNESGVDIAVLKFCYVDIRNDSDPQELFDRYQETFSELSDSFKETVFVHCTVPIESGPVGVKGNIKGCIKKLIQRPGFLDNNSARQRYNELLRTRYTGKELVFDIAQFEAISPEGMMAYQKVDSERVYLMDARYSDDGGHLNEFGRRIIAEQFLITLAEAANGRGIPEAPPSVVDDD